MTTKNETVLRITASLAVGGLFASGIAGYWYAWVILVPSLAGLGMDFYLHIRQVYPPTLKTYSVTLEHQFEASMRTLVVKARGKADAVNVALLEQPSYGRHYWQATKVVEHGQLQTSSDT